MWSCLWHVNNPYFQSQKQFKKKNPYTKNSGLWGFIIIHHATLSLHPLKYWCQNKNKTALANPKY